MILVVDTSGIISALIRDSSSRRVLLSPRFLFYTPDFTLDEINRYIPLITRKSSLPGGDVLLLINDLLQRIQVIGFDKYVHKYLEAEEIIGEIDPDDAPFIALALSIPNDGIWSNDKHFLKQDRVKIWTTGDLIKLI